MRKWRVIKQFYLGEESRIKDKDKDNDYFLLGEGSIIYESELTDRVIINGKQYDFRIGTAFTRFCVLEEIIPESVTGDTAPAGGLANLVWRGPTELVPVIPGKRYITPDKFQDETIVIAVRGLIVHRENEDGYVVIDDMTFEMKEWLLKPNDWVMCGYVIKT